jgi:hypothetical protein
VHPGRLRAPGTSRRASIELIDPARAHVTRLFFIVAQSFYYIISHFTITNSTTFTRVNSIILSHILEIFCSVILLDLTIHFFYRTKSFSDCRGARPFHVIKYSDIHRVIVLSHFSELRHFHSYSAHPFIVLLYSIVLVNSIIFNAIVLRSAIFPTVLNHFVILSAIKYNA